MHTSAFVYGYRIRIGVKKEMKVFVAGGTGFIGREVVKNLLQGANSVTVATRSLDRARGRCPTQVALFPWDARTPEPLVPLMESHDAVVHLAGESIGARWTPRLMERARASRVDSTRAITQAIQAANVRPSVFLQASATGYYGIRGDEEVDESSAPGKDFLARLCQEWEGASVRLSELGVRRIVARIGIVLSAKGGGLKKMLLPFKLGLGGPLGSGEQWWSWITLKDAAEAILYLLKNDTAEGIFNVTAPEPVRNREFTRTLARLLHRPAFLPMPPFALRLLFGEMADVLLLKGQKAIPRRLLEVGYSFRHPTLEAGLSHALSHK